jgi:hypothetical protein
MSQWLHAAHQGWSIQIEDTQEHPQFRKVAHICPQCLKEDYDKIKDKINWHGEWHCVTCRCQEPDGRIDYKQVGVDLHKAVLSVVEELVALDPDPDFPGAKWLNILADAAAAYEKVAFPLRVVTYEQGPEGITCDHCETPLPAEVDQYDICDDGGAIICRACSRQQQQPKETQVDSLVLEKEVGPAHKIINLQHRGDGKYFWELILKHLANNGFKVVKEGEPDGNKEK